MKSSLVKPITGCLIVLLLVLGAYSSVYADNRDPRFYLGVSLASNSIGTEDTAYSGSNETFYVPALNSGIGFALSGGINFGGGAIELGYTNSSHNGNYQNVPFNATYNLFDINFKGFFNPSDRPLNLYGMGGVCIAGLVVKDGAVSASGSADATYTGFGLNIGGGVDYRLNSRLSLNGEVLYRWVGFTDGQGKYDSGSLEGSLDGSGLCLNIGLNYYFN